MLKATHSLHLTGEEQLTSSVGYTDQGRKVHKVGLGADLRNKSRKEYNTPLALVQLANPLYDNLLKFLVQLQNYVSIIG